MKKIEESRLLNKKEFIKYLIIQMISLIVYFIFMNKIYRFKSLPIIMVEISIVVLLVLFFIFIMKIIRNKSNRRTFILLLIIDILLLLSEIYIFPKIINGNKLSVCDTIGSNYKATKMKSTYASKECIAMEEDADDNGKIWYCCPMDK